MAGEPILVEHFAAVAKTNGVTIEVTAPFPPTEPPAGLNVGEEFVRAAFGLTDTDPIAGPVMGKAAAYVIAAHSRLPSEAPKYEDVQVRVSADYIFYESAMAARAAGFMLGTSLSNAIAAGKTFTAACIEAKAKPVVIPAFSLTSTNVPEVEKHMNLIQFKQVLFMTPAGRASEFIPANDGGGFLVFVQQKLPVDEARLAAALPEYMKMVRQQRINDAVNAWVSAEGQRDAGFRAIMTALAKENQPKQQQPALPN